VRPLLAPGADVSAGETSREHAIWRDPSGLLNVAGGKLTTFREMAADAAMVVAEILKAEHGVISGDFRTEFVPIPGAPKLGLTRLVASLESRGKASGLSAEASRSLAIRYGEDANAILDLIAEDPTLVRPILPEHPYLMAEAVHAVRSEWGLTLEDVMRRRLHLFYEAADGGMSAATGIVDRIATESALGWTAEEAAAQIRRYAASVEETRPSGERTDRNGDESR
jgi:glycerol-3-phosphate dehydrogenase